MKVFCDCGNTIRDSVENHPCRAFVLKDQLADAFRSELFASLKAYVDSVRRGEKNIAAEQLWGTDAEVMQLAMIFGRVWNRFTGVIFECDACGNLFFLRENADANTELVAFYPESSAYDGVLAACPNVLGRQ